METINSERDFISDLPDNLVENILVDLTLKEAVRTSALSKSWRYKWITIPQLVFDSSIFSSSEHSQHTSNELPQFIHQVLLQHEGSISKFNLSIPRLSSCSEIDHSISFLSGKNIEEFTLCISEGSPHKIPLSFFSCMQMKLLCLHQCVFHPPTDFAGFAKLTNLDFKRVDLPARFSETFVAKCPLLEYLTLHRCTNLDVINFYAPNLKLLDYIGCIGSISFKNTPGLKKVSLNNVFPEFQEAWRTISWMETFCTLPSLEYLHLRESFFGITAVGVIPKRFASKFNCLVTLELSGIVIGHLRSAMCVVCLLKTSPNLKKLKIQFYENMRSDDPLAAKLFSKGIEASVFYFRKLQAVEMFSLKSLTAEMEFIKLLLAKSPVLETMHIYHLQGSSADQNFSAVQRINQWRRASPRAEVFFY